MPGLIDRAGWTFASYRARAARYDGIYDADIIEFVL